jgi:tRNA-binding protein
MTATWENFEQMDFRVGRIIEAMPFPEARKPAYKLRVDFGHLGIKNSSAQITDRYDINQLIGLQVIAVVNFPPKQIGKFMSECLVMGVYTDEGVVLLGPEQTVPEGSKIG